jgi:hypothetical protein
LPPVDRLRHSDTLIPYVPIRVYSERDRAMFLLNNAGLRALPAGHPTFTVPT